MRQIQADFCVVGSGISGMSAAYKLHSAGASVIVLEAAERLGGRMYSARMTDGRTMFEIGAEWVSDDLLQPSLRDLMCRLQSEHGIDFPTAEQYIRGDNVFIDFDGSVRYYDATPSDESQATGLPPISDSAQAELIAAFAALTYMSTLVQTEERWKLVPFDPALSGGVESTVAADRMTLHNWLEANFSQPAAKALVAALFRGTMGLEAEAITLLHVIFFLNTFGCDPQNVFGARENETQHLRMTRGVSSILDAILQAVGPERFINNEPVREIEQLDGSVLVTANTVQVTARRVIVATSTAAVNFIRFLPPLPPDRAQVQQRMGLGSFWKIWLAYDKPFWREPGYAGRKNGLSGAIACIKKDAFVGVTLDSSLDPDGPGLMTCFIDADKARAFAHMSPEKRRETVIQEMVRAFGAPAANLSTKVLYPAALPQNPEPSAYFEWNWSLPEFIRGDYAGVPGPGVYTAEGFGPAIQQACGRVHWAGSDLGQECYGAMTGAVFSGESAANNALELEPDLALAATP